MGKKIISTLVSVVLGISFLVQPSYAESKPTPNVTTFKEIKDKKELLERAKKGISDIDLTSENGEEEIVPSIGSDNKLLKIKKYKTAQLLRKEVEADGTVTSTYALTTIALASPSRTDSIWDQTSSVEVYSTIYWNKTVKNGLTYKKLTSASGGWTIAQVGVTTTSSYSYTVPSSVDAVTAAGSYIVANVGITSTATISAFGSSWVLTANNRA
ncbi:hypothetical protein [Paenibacillus sp. MMS18-CY102]|uniref:hypothetical protein n=1 Tax=Paenibacillus sp. MMS18-CY102 TaxID=2682849 RepID=UPI0013651E97|nr:hypothetical protein [Paenibacillus sp. MMS18-CY102]MWC27042.1 hypothetical protein [Paenibacillus sp. MMS18-CY102]